MTRNVVISGANRGIGLALTQAYLSNNDNVYAVCRQASNELIATDAKIISGVDVSKPEDIQALLEGLNNIDIDILINNAGILRSQSLQDLNFDLIEKQFAINAMAPLRVVEALLNSLKPGSKIAMITSRMGSIADNSSGSSYGYRMSKCALNIAGKSLSIDLKPKQIAVALLHPGYVQTAMVGFGGEISPEVSAERLIQRIEELNLENSGSFWHSNGEVLPW